ncbi:unnamed protein product [Coccothraustes coccothraustes]
MAPRRAAPPSPPGEPAFGSGCSAKETVCSGRTVAPVVDCVLCSVFHAYELVMSSKPVGLVSHMSSPRDKCWDALEGFFPMHTSLEAGSGYACCLLACWESLKTKTENGQKQVHGT